MTQNKGFGGITTMAKAGARDKLTLACTECKQRNYQTYKNKKNNTERLELKKYCPFCRKHTIHRESK
jgi:large subunit ribosomal protein L33